MPVLKFWIQFLAEYEEDLFVLIKLSSVLSFLAASLGQALLVDTLLNESTYMKAQYLKLMFKGYLRYKFFCHEVVLDVLQLNFFIWRKNVSFSKYLDFRVFVKSTDFKICDVFIGFVT